MAVCRDATPQPAAWWPVGAADCHRDLQLSDTGLVCSELQSRLSSAMCAWLSLSWRGFRISEHRCRSRGRVCCWQRSLTQALTSVMAASWSQAKAQSGVIVYLGTMSPEMTVSQVPSESAAASTSLLGDRTLSISDVPMGSDDPTER